MAARTSVTPSRSRATAMLTSGCERRIGRVLLAPVRRRCSVISIAASIWMEVLMKVEGSCHCGQITYEAEIDPDSVHICNCTDCQMLTGSGFRVAAHAPATTFRMVTGQPKVYVKTAQSGSKRRHSFCPNCGTPVRSSADTDDPLTYSLRVGCLKQRAQLPPKKRNWCRSALVWAQNISVLPGKDTQ